MVSDNLEESYHVNMIINLLVRFPDIFTITYNIAASCCSLSYMIKRELKKTQYNAFRDQLEQNLEAYRFFKKKEHHKITVQKKTFRGLTQLEIFLPGDQLVSSEIGLITKIVRDTFGQDLICEIRPEEHDNQDEGPAAWEELPELLLNRNPGNEVKHLFAFRDSGKVYVFDK